MSRAVLRAILAASSGGVAADSDVTAYAAAVTTAGGTLPATHQTALNTYMPALKASGAWALIKELWLPLGNNSDLTTAAVKFKNGATSPTVTLTNFVSTDYTVAVGLYTQASNATKRVVTDLVPSTTSGLTATEWGMSYYGTKLHVTGVAMGSNANANSYITYAGGSAKIGGVTISTQPTNSPVGEVCTNARLSSMQTTAGSIYAYVGGAVRNTITGTTSAQTGGLSVFATNNTFYSSGATGGYAVHAPMTAAHLRALQTFFDNVSEAIGRTVFADDLRVVGDSYVSPTPTGPTATTNSWTYLLAAQRGYAGGWVAGNNGVPGAGWSPPCSGGYMSNGNNGRDRIHKAMLQAPSKHVIIALGLNDAFQAGDRSICNSTSAATFAFLNAVGYPLKYIALGTNYWATPADLTLGTGIHDDLLVNAAAAGITQVVDFFYGGTYNNTSVESGVHKGDAGHVLLKNDVVNAITSGSWAGW